MVNEYFASAMSQDVLAIGIVVVIGVSLYMKVKKVSMGEIIAKIKGVL